MARDEIERLYALGLIGPWEIKKLRGRARKKWLAEHADDSPLTNRGMADGAVGLDHIEAKEYQRPKRGAGFDDPRQQSANFPTGRDHIDRRKGGARQSWERPRRPDARWTEKTPSVSRARKSSGSEWNPDWYFGTPERR
jgi:hypothetical protein